MKKVFLFLFTTLCVNLFSFSQEPKPLAYSKVIQADGMSKDVIYGTLLEWIQSNYHGVSNDSQLSDKDAGYIMKDAAIPYVKKSFYKCYGGFIYYKMKFQVKDGRFKVDLFNFTHHTTMTNCSFPAEMGIITDAVENPLGGGMNKSANDKVWEELKGLCAEKANELFDKFEDIDFKEYNSDLEGW